MIDKSIVIKNIYYMLAYSFQVLAEKNYERIEGEDFQNAEDLFSEILAIGVSKQLKQGLYKEYISREENLKVLRGKLILSETIKNRAKNNRQELFCEHDDLSEDNIYNQILKATISSLSRNRKVKKNKRNELRKILFYFRDVSDIELSMVKWARLTFQRNNQTYVMLMNICYFIYNDMILSNEEGSKRVLSFSDEHMEAVYEKFIWEYYNKHHKELRMGKLRVFWDLSEGRDENAIKFLPHMKSDVKLLYEDKTLIIDAKYYTKMMQENFGSFSVRNSHLYQIFSYVKNEDKTNSGKVSGMLLYAKTMDEHIPYMDEMISGSRIGVRVLDLNRTFDDIKKQLDDIVDDWKKS